MLPNRHQIAWIYAAALFLSLLLGILSSQKEVLGSIDFIDDGFHTEASIAVELQRSGTFGLDRGHPVPAGEGAIWIVLLAAVAPLAGGPVSAALLIEAAAGVWLLWTLVGLCRMLGAGFPATALALLLAALAPGLAFGALEGRGIIVASLLLVYAVQEHLRCLLGRRNTLPLTAAVLVGLLAWMRVEFVALWIVFIFHALADEALDQGERSYRLVLLRGLSGLVVILLCLFPLVVWNIALTGVAWPRVYSAPLHMGGGSQTLGSYLGLTFQGIFVGLREWFRLPLLSHPVTALLGILALAAGIHHGWQRGYIRQVLMFPALALFLPVAMAPLYPFLGSGAMAAVFAAAAPLLLPVMAMGMTGVGERALRGRFASSVRTRLVYAVGALVLLAFALFNLLENRPRVERLAERVRQRAVAVEILDRLDPGALIATDRPGLLAGRVSAKLLDLTGRCSPDVLRYLNMVGRHDEDSLARLQADHSPAAWVIWGSDAAIADRVLGPRTPYPEGRRGPDLWIASE